MKPTIAVLSFPGNNGDTENVQCLWRNGFDAFVFRSQTFGGVGESRSERETLADVDGYFIGAGFSFEDRGRAGMVAARDPLFAFLHDESKKGKVIVGHCNGCQMLVESGLIPLGSGLRMALAKNIQQSTDGHRCVSPGFLNEWIYMRRTCARDRCCSSDWDGVMHIPIAHGEGRFVTKDPDLIAGLEANDQIAFRYCDHDGNVSQDDPSINPNGSTDAIAGICNPSGNVVAMMPHAERTRNGDPYFQSIRRWIVEKKKCESKKAPFVSHPRSENTPQKRPPHPLEIFIDTVIVNNEEQTVQQAARRIVPSIILRQFRYLAPTQKKANDVLTDISLFNANKEVAYVREAGDGGWKRWHPNEKRLTPASNPLSELVLVRRDEPDTGARALGEGSVTGVAYAIRGMQEQHLCSDEVRSMFANPHSSTLEIVQ